MISSEKQPGFVVPLEKVSEHALNALIQEFILREGTDYGVREYSLDEKNIQVLKQLQQGRVLIVFDPSDETCSLLRKEDLPKTI